MCHVLLYSLTVYKNVVEKHDNATSQQGMEHLIHKRLERCWRIHQTERHHGEFKMTVMRSKSCLGYVLLLNSYLMVPCPQVKLCKYPGSIQFIEKFVHGRNRKSITDGDGIQGSIIHAEAPCPVLLFDEENRR